MAIDKVKAYFAEFGREGDVMEFPTSSATVELAAQAVGCEPARIAKTLSFAVGDRVALVVCAGDARIANPKFKAQFGTKPRMLPAEEAEERVGHAVGGVCPFAVNEDCDVYLDESLRRFDVVYPACGSSNSAIALAPDELAACTPGSTWVDVCKLPEAWSSGSLPQIRCFRSYALSETAQGFFLRRREALYAEQLGEAISRLRQEKGRFVIRQMKMPKPACFWGPRVTPG